MNSLKMICVGVVLAALGYGGYRMLTGPTTKDAPPADALGWERGAQIELPPGLALSPPAATSVPATPAAAGPPPAFTSSVPLAAAMPGDPSSAAPPTMSEPPRYVTPSAAPAMPETSAPPFASPAASSAPSATLPGASIGAMPESAGPTANLTSAGIDPVGQPPAADAHAEFAKVLTEVQPLLAQQRLTEALEVLSPWCLKPNLAADDRTRLYDLLDQLAGIVVYSREHLLEQPYAVQPGDTLETIAQRYDVSWQLLAKINGLASPTSLQPGTTLKVIRGPFDAVVDLSDLELTLLLRDRYAGRFRIGLGQDVPAPEGEFKVRNKVQHPPYNGPDQALPSDDPANPLGKYWLDLGNQFGIHGTNNPASIGQTGSRGNIRLGPRDDEDVFDILTVGSSVMIRR